MKYLPLVWAGLWRKRVRTVLTLLSVVTAFLLYGILDGVTAGFDGAIDRLTDGSRLRTQNRINIAASLPVAYLPRIESVPGVTGVAYFNFFGGYYQESANSVGAGALDVQRIGTVNADFIVPEDHLEAMRRTRTGAIAGPELLEKYGWRIGDQVTLKSSVWTQKDGSNDWTFDIVGTYAVKEGAFPSNDEFWINYDYFDEARSFANGTVTLYIVKVDDARRAAEIAAQIDSLFMNSTDETLTQTEGDFIRAQIERVGNINFIVNAIVGAVLFTLLFLTGNTMMQSIRERVPELAVLKTYGFSGAAITSLVFAESLLLCLTAAAIGLGIAAAVFPAVYDSMGIAPLPLEGRVLVTGAAIAVLLALVSALPPVWRAQRLNVVDALAGR
jgi:putative ABC transport system permease protein